jgi:hypothetical protein
MQEEQLASQEKQVQMQMQFKADESEKDRQKDITVAEIRSAGYGAQSDINQNQQSDYLDAMAKIQDQQRYRDEMNLKRESHLTNKLQQDEKLDVEREKLSVQKEIAIKKSTEAELKRYLGSGSSKKDSIITPAQDSARDLQGPSLPEVPKDSWINQSFKPTPMSASPSLTGRRCSARLVTGTRRPSSTKASALSPWTCGLATVSWLSRLSRSTRTPT